MGNNILTKMASFKILLVVALVAFIGSTDALKCKKVGDTNGETCGEDKKSCVIEVKLKLTAGKPEIDGAVVKQACDATDLGKATKKFAVPAAIAAATKVSFYCKEDDCNVKKAIEDQFKPTAAETVTAMNKVTEDHKTGKKSEANLNPSGAANHCCCCHHRLQYGLGSSCPLKSNFYS